MHFIDLQNDIAAQVGALTMHCQDNHEAEYLRRLFLLRQRAQAHEAKADRTGTGRHSIFGGYIRHDTGHYGPAFYQTKKVHVPSILGELRWMLSGSSSVKPLQAEGIRIWNEWADANGNLGPIYGHAWRQTRKWVESNDSESDQHYERGADIDQIRTMLQIALERPADSGNLVSAWNVAELDQMALRPCHTLWQICIQDGKLDLMLYQRSADWFLGVPFNAAFYTTLQSMLAKMLGLKPGIFHHYFGDTHLYANQLDVADEHLSRLITPIDGRLPCPLAWHTGRDDQPHPEALQLEFHNLPDLKALGKVPASHCLLRNLGIDDIQLLNYSPAPAIVAPRAAV